jgi:hypothetical protein
MVCPPASVLDVIARVSGFEEVIRAGQAVLTAKKGFLLLNF